MEVITIVTKRGIAVAAVMEQVGLALQRLDPVEFLVALVTLETIRITEDSDAGIHIVVDPDTVTRTWET